MGERVLLLLLNRLRKSLTNQATNRPQPAFSSAKSLELPADFQYHRRWRGRLRQNRTKHSTAKGDEANAYRLHFPRRALAGAPHSCA